MKNGIVNALVCGALALLVVGCQCTPPGSGVVPSPAPDRAVAYTPDSATSSVVYVYGRLASGIIRVEKTIPAEIQLGDTFDYQIKVTNLTEAPVRGVIVTETLPEGFKVLSATPDIDSTAGEVSTWKLGTLAPKESKYIRVSGSATKTGSLEWCGRADFDMVDCVTMRVVEPLLEVAVTAPKSVLICDSIPVTYTVTNTGTGMASDVAIASALPKGLVTSDGKSELVFPTTSLLPGKSQQVSAMLKANKTGKLSIPVAASGARGLKAEGTPATVVVHEPKLEITKKAPKKLYLFRDMTYQITVRNVGDAPADSTVVTDTLPTSVEFISASDGGIHALGTVKWSVGALYPGKEKTLSVVVRAREIGALRNVAKAEAVCTKTVSATASTEVNGIAAILLEVIDIADPVPVGSNETYVITATNQGSAVDTNVKVVCTLEPNQTYVSSSGATVGKAAGNVITFAPLPRLAAKAKAEWRLVVKAVKAGDVRFKASMTSDQLGRPVEETEATHLYE